MRKVKIVVTVPEGDLTAVREAMFGAGAGKIGKYTHCSTAAKVVGTFLPGEDAKPRIGEPGKFEEVEEIRLEMVCDFDKVSAVVQALRSAHPYEEPAIDIIPLLEIS